jgi:signal peptidase II
MLKRLRIIFPILLLLILLDQFSKYFIKTHFFFFTKITVIKGFINIVYVKNKGVAFGFLSEVAKNIREPFLLWIPAITCLVLLIYVTVNKKLSQLEVFGFIFIIGGALGNLIDRILYGFVIDFIDCYIGKLHWPAFNLADSFITIGIILIFIDVVINRR